MGSDLQFRKITQAAWWETDEGRGDGTQPSPEVISGEQVRNDRSGRPGHGRGAQMEAPWAVSAAGPGDRLASGEGQR